MRSFWTRCRCLVPTRRAALNGAMTSTHAPVVRWSALCGLVASLILLAAVVIPLADHPWKLLGALLCVAVGVPAAWAATTNRRSGRLLRITSILLGAIALVLVVLGGRSVPWSAAVIAAGLVAAWTGGRAMRWEVEAAIARRWRPAPPAEHGVLLMNPRSGGGTVERCNLVEEARVRGVDPVIVGPDDDLRQLAETAVHDGADVIGMAGGDGSLAIVAEVAADHDIAFVCVPAGTRNHLALDLGVNREDVVGALDAFGAAREAEMDLATVNDHVFVNNVSLGLYAEIVKSDAYREREAASRLPRLTGAVGTRREGFDLSITYARRGAHRGRQLAHIPTGLRAATTGSVGIRPQLDTGQLGIVVLRIDRPADVAAFLRLEATARVARSPGPDVWKSDTVQVDSGSTVAAGIDGEAVELDPPLVFSIRERPVRVRIAHTIPGVARRDQARDRTIDRAGLVRIARGRPSGLIVETRPRALSRTG